MKIYVIIFLQTCGILLFAFILSYNLIPAKRKLGNAYMGYTSTPLGSANFKKPLSVYDEVPAVGRGQGMSGGAKLVGEKRLG